MLLIHAGKKPGDVLERDQGYIEAIAKSNKSSRFYRGVDVEHTRQEGRLISDNADRVASKPCEPDDDIRSVQILNLKKITIVYYRMNNIANIVRLIRGLGYR